jgi:hypothetical protein
MRSSFLLPALLACFSVAPLLAQEWSLELSSTVDIRSLKLTNKVEKTEKGLAGATIALYQGSNIVRQVKSDANGEFVIAVPADNEYILVVSYQGYNAKRFIVSTKGVPQSISADDFRPSFSIGGFTMAKALPGIDYSILKEPLVRVTFAQSHKKFDDDENYTDRMLDRLSELANAENELIEKFVGFNRAGDAALAKNDCPLAKMNYEKAIALIAGEQYPVTQLAKVGLCLKEKELLAASQKTVEAKPKENEELVKTEKDSKVKVEESTDEKIKLLAAEKAKEKGSKKKPATVATTSEAPAKSSAVENNSVNAKPVAVADLEPEATTNNNLSQTPSKPSIITKQRTSSGDNKTKKFKKGESKYTIRPKL